MKKTKIKAKAAPAIVWIKGTRAGEWMGGISGKPVFEIRDDGVLGHYSSPRSAKRGAERLAKRMREIFA